MSNYQFLDGNGSVLTAGSSVIGGVHYPQVYIQGSVATYISGGNQSVSGTVNIGAMPGSVAAFQAGTQITSLIGGYAEDSPHTSGDIGLFTLAVRNDTMASITSTDKDYSPHAVGGAGEILVANAPLTQWVQGVASCFTGVAQPIIAAQGSSVFTYLTSGQVANASPNNVYLTFLSGGVTIGYLPVPGSSGALPIMPNAWKGASNAAITASVSGVASVFLSFQGFTAKT